MQEVIPGTLLDKNKAKEFVIWLKALPLDIEDKRTLLRLWVDRVGVRITGGITTRAGLN